MQTFLPYPDFVKTAACLDYKRLGKQRVEALQIYNIICGITEKQGWRNHPAVKMWKGYNNALALYYNIIVIEWIGRKYKNSMKLLNIEGVVEYPFWFGNEKFHASHRSNLLRKDYEYYSQFGWKEPNNLPYYWPVK